MNVQSSLNRFLSFLQPENHTADGISKCLLEELRKIKLDETPENVIYQSYDGASVMSSRNNGVQAKIKEMYKNANYIHCYAHQLNQIVKRVASQNKQMKVFFCNLAMVFLVFLKDLQSALLYWMRLWKIDFPDLHQPDGTLIKQDVLWVSLNIK
jgi:hypothetical protein